MDPDPSVVAKPRSRGDSLARLLVIPLAVVLLAGAPPLYLTFGVTTVRGRSMEPSLHSGERMLVTRGLSVPRRGDTVVIAWTHGAVTEEIVKRVIGLPGDRIVVAGDTVTVDGTPEAFPHQVLLGQTATPSFVTTVGAGTVFVMGDNRPDSLDSRFIGALPISGIQGRVVAVWAPLGAARVVPSP